MKRATAFAVASGLVALAALAACVGSDAAGTSASAGDASTGGADAPVTTPGTVGGGEGSDAAGCAAEIAGNLMTNGSFTGGHGGWDITSQADVSLAPADAGPGADCRGTYGVVRVDTGYSGATYDVLVPSSDAGPDAMVNLAFGVSVLPLGDDYDQIDAKLAEFDDTHFEIIVSATGLQPNQWREITGTLAVRPGSTATLRVTSPTPRSFGVDRAWIVAQ